MFKPDDDRLKHIVAALFVEDRATIEGPYFKDSLTCVDEAEENEEDGMREITFSYHGAHSLEDDSFPTGEILAMNDVEPGENDRFSNEVLVRYDDLVDDHVVLLQGNHSSPGNSDESWEGYVSGCALIVPADRVEDQIKIMMLQHQKKNLADAENRLRNLIIQVRDIDPEVIEGSGLLEKVSEFNRIFIR